MISQRETQHKSTKKMERKNIRFDGRKRTMEEAELKR